MSKINSIRWRDSDEKKLKNSIRNFNAKIDRQVKKGVNINALPEKLNYKTIKKETTNRKDFDKILKESDKFRQRGSEKIITNDYGIQKTKFEIESIKKDVQRINRERKKKADAVEQGVFTVAGSIIDKQEINTIKKKFNFEKIKVFLKSLKYSLYLSSLSFPSKIYPDFLATPDEGIFFSSHLIWILFKSIFTKYY